MMINIINKVTLTTILNKDNGYQSIIKEGSGRVVSVPTWGARNTSSSPHKSGLSIFNQRQALEDYRHDALIIISTRTSATLIKSSTGGTKWAKQGIH